MKNVRMRRIFINDFLCSRKLKIENIIFKIITIKMKGSMIMDKENIKYLFISIILTFMIMITVWTPKLIEWNIISVRR